MLSKITLIELLTIAALFLGPISAVCVTRYWDGKRETNRRKWEVFRTLMQNRRQPLNPEFVGALNLIEVEFHKEGGVIDAWKNLFNQFDQQFPSIKTEQDKYQEEIERLTAILLEKMAKSLGVQKDTLEIVKSGYTPQGWGDLENENAIMRRFVLEVLEDKRPFPVKITNLPNGQNIQSLDSPNQNPM